MAKLAVKRLQSDLTKLQSDPPPGVSGDLCNDNLFEWNAVICGPVDSPFDGGLFKIRIKFPEDFPNKPPSVWFHSTMFHPNVYPNGKICLDVLEKEDYWSSEFDAATILVAIQAMLACPNPESPANGEACNLFKNNKEEYRKRIQEIVVLSNERAKNGSIQNFNVVEEDERELEARLAQLDLRDVDNPEEFRNFVRQHLKD